MNDSAAALFVIHMAGPGQPAPPDLFGVWHSPPAGPAPDGAPALVVWRADLPRQAGSARQTLAASERLLRRAEIALPQAEQRLGFISGQAQGGGAAEDQLRLELRQYAQLQQAAVGPDPAARAYGLDWAVPAGFASAAEDASCFFQTVRLAAARLTRIETAVDGQRIALTECRWNGSLQTWCSPRLDAKQAAGHYQLVEQALVSRRAVIRMGMLISAGAAALMTSAFTGPLALLSVFQFVKEIIAEVQQLR